MLRVRGERVRAGLGFWVVSLLVTSVSPRAPATRGFRNTSFDTKYLCLSLISVVVSSSCQVFFRCLDTLLFSPFFWSVTSLKKTEGLERGLPCHPAQVTHSCMRDPISLLQSFVHKACFITGLVGQSQVRSWTSLFRDTVRRLFQDCRLVRTSRACYYLHRATRLQVYPVLALRSRKGFYGVRARNVFMHFVAALVPYRGKKCPEWEVQ